MEMFKSLDDVDLLLDLSWFTVNLCILHISKNLKKVDNSDVIRQMIHSGVVSMIKKAINQKDKDIVASGLRIVEFLFQGKKEINQQFLQMLLDEQILHKI